MVVRRTQRLLLTLGIITVSLALTGCRSAIYHGRVAVKGNEPFTYVALVGKTGKEFSIIGALKSEIRKSYQGRYLKVRGRLIRRDTQTTTEAALPEELEVLEVLEVKDKPF